ncbi:hypothetical protein [Nitrosococcus oceani]|uniref:hypothetical protein n=1 Tax=Nitrosococcus oceani TaxID=1229 RepID=UPI001E2CB6AF|nr:hypothetical protein [Nitrosococcus oceani]
MNDGVYTWDGGGFITQSGALGLADPDAPLDDFIVPDIAFLTGDWTGRPSPGRPRRSPTLL